MMVLLIIRVWNIRKEEKSSRHTLINLTLTQRKYELFQVCIEIEEANVLNIKETASLKAKSHPPIIEVVHDSSDDTVQPHQLGMPLLVYVAREKRPTHPHNFKAGAINVLLRVSTIVSNSPYILMLDCDMYCNDSTSARQAMCFHLDPKVSPSLAFVQFPQKFHSISKNDIYDSQLRTTFMVAVGVTFLVVHSHYWILIQVRWPGIDGLQGPLIAVWDWLLHEERSIIWESFAERHVP